MKDDGSRPDFETAPRVAARSPLHRTAAPPTLSGRAARKAAKAARAKAEAGREGRFEAGTRVVDDPLEPGARLTARVNLAEHPLEFMRARRRLEEAHYCAGVRFRAIYERAMIGAARGIDPAKVKVDGGGMGDPLDGGVAEAHVALSQLAGWLGPVGYRLVEEVCGRGQPIEALAQVWPSADNPRKVQNYLSMRLTEALEVLARNVWGATGPARGRLDGWRQAETRPDVRAPEPAEVIAASARHAEKSARRRDKGA